MAVDDKEDSEPGDGRAPTVVIEDLDFDVRMTEVQKVEFDPESEDLDDLFTVTFAVDGPNASAAVEIMVTDADDIEVVAVALDTLHGALMAWANLIQRRREATKTEMLEGQVGT